MKPPTQQQAIIAVVDLVARLVGVSPKLCQWKPTSRARGCDFSLATPLHRFLVKYSPSASAGPLAAAVDRLRGHLDAHPSGSLPLIVVPFMGPIGHDLCERRAVPWLDLSGNARIAAPGLRIHVEGRPNQYLDRGRPPNPFAPKSARVTRQLLLHPRRFMTQAALARLTDLDDGYVSKIVRRLEREEYLEVDDAGGVRPRDPSILLDAWHAAYEFNRHRILKGHVQARSGEELLERLSRQLFQLKLAHAVTGLGAAWLMTHFAAFRLVTIYLDSMPPAECLRQLEFSPEPRGANLWLVLPDDDGVFHGTQTHADIPCVSPVQTYIDLKAQPERARDAGIELRRQLLHWSNDGE